MKLELIERLAREAGFSLSVLDCNPPHYYLDPSLQEPLARFAALVANECFLSVVRGTETLPPDHELAVRRAAERIRAKFLRSGPSSSMPLVNTNC